MATLIRLLGIAIVAFGVMYLLNPDIIKPYMVFWLKGKRIYGGAVLSLVIGIVFLLAAAQCAVSWFIALFGILALVKGIVLFVTGEKKVKSWLNWWVERSVMFRRIHAVTAIIMGVLLIYAA